jgi:hypothetical protein
MPPLWLIESKCVFVTVGVSCEHLFGQTVLSSAMRVVQAPSFFAIPDAASDLAHRYHLRLLTACLYTSR